MSAYWEAAMYCESGEAYNIGSLTTIKVAEVLDQLIALSTSNISARVDSKLLRLADVTLQVPSMDKFLGATGWSPKYLFNQSLEDFLNYWCVRARAVVDIAVGTYDSDLAHRACGVNCKEAFEIGLNII